MKRACRTCREEKPTSEFWRLGDGWQYDCKACQREINRETQRRKRERLGPLALRARYLWEKYRLPWAEYERLLEAQAGGCAICGGSPDAEQHEVLAVDHDHKTGNVRGLLCRGCNQGIGHFHDDAEALRAAALYLDTAVTCDDEASITWRRMGAVPSGAQIVQDVRLRETVS